MTIRKFTSIALLGIGLAGLAAGLVLAAAPAQPAGPNLARSAKRIDRSLPGVGEAVTYTLVLSNSGLDTTTVTVLTDALPEGLVIDPAWQVTATSGLVTNTGTFTSPVIVWTGAVSPALPITLTLPVTVNTCRAPVVNSAVIADPDIAAPVVISVSAAEGFESRPDLPPGWLSTVLVTGTTPISIPVWTWITAGVNFTSTLVPPHSGLGMLRFNSFDVGMNPPSAGEPAARLSTRDVPLPHGYAPGVRFWMFHDTVPWYEKAADRLVVQYSQDGGLSYTGVVTVYRHTGAQGWSLHTVGLPPLPAGPLRIGFLGVSGYGNDVLIDDVALLFTPSGGAIDVVPPLFHVAGQETRFEGSTDADPSQTGLAWRFSDAPVVLPGATVTRTFPSGQYTATLNACGNDLISRTFTILPPPGVVLDTSAPTPFSASTYFTTSQVIDSDPVTYVWDFGDGSPAVTSTANTVSYLYPDAGTYQAGVAIVGSGQISLATRAVVVLPVSSLAIVSGFVSPPTATVLSLAAYWATVSNGGPSPTAGVRLTHTLSSQVAVADARLGGGACKVSGAVVTCTLGSLAAGQAVSASIIVTPISSGFLVDAMSVSGASFDPNPGDNQAVLTATVRPKRYFLPQAARIWPPIPSVPVMKAIDNPNQLNFYPVTWYAASQPVATNPITYTLQEAIDPGFAGPVERYTGAELAWQAIGQAVGVYYYRVRAANRYGSSEWSAVVSTSVALPDPPVLDPITQVRGDQYYTVTWSAVSRALYYVLQESKNAQFLAATPVYTGSNTQLGMSKVVTRESGVYYYRVQSVNWVGASEWSNVQSHEASPSPYNGRWAGTTSQGKPISLTVTSGAVTFLQVQYATANCSNEAAYYYTPPVYVDGGAFSLVSTGATYSYRVNGVFSSAVSASGNATISRIDQCYGAAAITWTAAKAP